MREIIFRGKRRYDKKWVYGNLVIDKNEKPHIVPKDYFYEDGHHLQYYDDTDKPVFIDPATVGQYTGLTDKNGTKIFERDIVLTINDDIAIIQYDEEDAMYYLNDDNALTNFGIVSTKFIEVIGNIHDNPELLEGGAEDE